jgi:hypothetical protein
MFNSYVKLPEGNESVIFIRVRLLSLVTRGISRHNPLATWVRTHLLNKMKTKHPSFSGKNIPCEKCQEA